MPLPVYQSIHFCFAETVEDCGQALDHIVLCHKCVQHIVPPFLKSWCCCCCCVGSEFVGDVHWDVCGCSRVGWSMVLLCVCSLPCRGQLWLAKCSTHITVVYKTYCLWWCTGFCVVMCTYIFGLVAMIHPNPCWFWKQPSVVMGAVSSLVVHPRVPVGVLRLCGEELLVCCVIHPTVVALFWSLLLVKVVVVSFWTYQCLFLLYCYRQRSRQLCQHKCVVLHASSYLCL